MGTPLADGPHPPGRTTEWLLWGLVGFDTMASLAAVRIGRRSMEDAVRLVLLTFLFATVTLGVGAVAIRRRARDGAVVAGSVAVFASLFILPFPGDYPVSWFRVVDGCVLLLGGLTIFAWRIRSRMVKPTAAGDPSGHAGP